MHYLWLCLPLPLLAQDATQIMARMAENLESGTDARLQYVYRQTVKARLVRTNGQVARSEVREYTALPGRNRTQKKLESLAGEWHKSKKVVVRYTEPGFKSKGMDLDGELMENLIDDLAASQKSRDGIPHAMFPFRADDLPHYQFTYLDQTPVAGRPAHRIAFEPKARKTTCLNIGDDDDDDPDCRAMWKGEVLVDAEDVQPVRVTTDTTFKMPRGVKMFLGTDIRQVGFSVNYARVAPGVWFPATYGTEFRLDVLFGYKRVITMSLESKEFRKTDVDSKITYGDSK